MHNCISALIRSIPASEAGLDAVGLTLESAAYIRKFEQASLQAQPWLV